MDRGLSCMWVGNVGWNWAQIGNFGKKNRRSTLMMWHRFIGTWPEISGKYCSIGDKSTKNCRSCGNIALSKYLAYISTKGCWHPKFRRYVPKFSSVKPTIKPKISKFRKIHISTMHHYLTFKPYFQNFYKKQ